jgi:hypothetical protein
VKRSAALRPLKPAAGEQVRSAFWHESGALPCRLAGRAYRRPSMPLGGSARALTRCCLQAEMPLTCPGSFMATMTRSSPSTPRPAVVATRRVGWWRRCGGQPWHCPLAANLDSTANLEGDILERDPVTEVLGQVPDFDRRRPGRGLPLSPVAIPPAQADQFEHSVLAAHDAAFPGDRPRIERFPSCRVLVRGLEALAKQTVVRIPAPGRALPVSATRAHGTPVAAGSGCGAGRPGRSRRRSRAITLSQPKPSVIVNRWTSPW